MADERDSNGRGEHDWARRSQSASSFAHGTALGGCPALAAARKAGRHVFPSRPITCNVQRRTADSRTLSNLCVVAMRFATTWEGAHLLLLFLGASDVRIRAQQDVFQLRLLLVDVLDTLIIAAATA